MEQNKQEQILNTAQETNNKKTKPKWIGWLVWLIIAICILTIYLILIFWCNLQPWWLIALIMLDYLLLLIINYLNKFKKKLNWLFSLLLAILPVLILVFVGSWTWWMWLLVIGFYLLTLGTYFMGILMENYWKVSIPLSLFLILLIISIINSK